MALSPKLQKPSACAGCELERRGHGYASVDGPLHARLTFIAEALGAEEAILGRPLMGAAGGVHTRILTRAGISRDLTRADNCCRCMPPQMWFDEKAPWFYPALSHCRQYLQTTLDQVPSDAVVVTLGATALRSVLNLHGVEGVSVQNFHHTVNRSVDDRYWVVPSFHPSFLQRGAMNLLEIVTSAYRLADRVTREGFRRTPTTLVVDPHPDIYRSWVHEHLRRVQADPDGTHLSLDTEFKDKGDDEAEIDVSGSATSPLTRINVGNDSTTGMTVRYEGPYIAITEELLAGLAARQGIVLAWNKYADWDHLQNAGHTLNGIQCYDGMWAWHYLQSDVPRGLGFVAPLASDFGPWKHWSKVPDLEGKYAAADAVQNWRTCMWVLKALHQARMWDTFNADWHERDVYVLRPARAMGVPADRAALEAFHQDLQEKQAAILVKVKAIGAEGVLKPKQGYAERPSLGCCGHCNGSGHPLIEEAMDVGNDPPVGTGRFYYSMAICRECVGAGTITPPPPKSILGIQKGKSKSEAKQAYIAEGIALVARTVSLGVRVCQSCGATEIGPKHNCLRKTRRKDAGQADGPVAVPLVLSETRQVQRWFWRLPFNPGSWQQVLAYIESHGHQPGTHRKTRKPTTDKESLKKLAAETSDPLYQLLLDGRAVEKVDSTYAVGSLNRLDADSRLHPEITPKPSTLRDSSVGPNLQNVVADKDNTKTLAAGFRRCIVARDGIPAVITEAEVVAWRTRWQIA